MKAQIPNTDSIDELARFWDAHDVTEFDAELEEVASPFRRPDETVLVPLTAAEQRLLQEMASSRGLDQAALIHEWVREKLR